MNIECKKAKKVYYHLAKQKYKFVQYQEKSHNEPFIHLHQE